MGEEETPSSEAVTSVPESTNLIPTSTPDTSSMAQTQISSRQLQNNGPYAAGVYTAEVPFKSSKVPTPDMHQAQTINPQTLVEEAQKAGKPVPPTLEKLAQKTDESPKTLRQEIGDRLNNLLRRGSTKTNTN